MIDLHIHTSYSDGSDNLIKILSKCEERKLEIISITDHDTIEAYKELKNLDIKKYYTGIIIPGIEIKTTFNRIPIEVLGYNINLDIFKNSRCVNLDEKIKIQNKQLKNYIRVGKELGIICNESIKIKSSKEFAAVTYYDEIIKYPENFKILPEILSDKRENFYRITSGNINSPFYIDESSDSLDINFVINEIHNAGGKAFLAHLYQYKINNHESFLEEIIKNTNIDGVEAYYSSFTKEETNCILNICNKHKKLISGGTDYHGISKKGIEIGTGYGNLNINKNIINNWN